MRFATFKTSHVEQTVGLNPNLRRTVNLDLYVKLEDVREVIVLEEERYQYQHNANGISTGSHGTLAKALAYKEMFETYFRRKSTGYKTILTLPAKLA